MEMPRRTYRRCAIEGCEGNVVAKDVCDLHYRRLLHHGDVERGRPTDWGRRESHPLYQQWTWLHRSNRRVDESWKDFWSFVTDVGGPPSENHRIWRIDETKPYGPSNFFWREKSVLKSDGETHREYHRRYMQEYRKRSPEKVRNVELRKHYGIGIDEYEAKWREQNGVCAICMKPETCTHKKTGLPMALAVDHCHKSGHVRKLLCQSCNRGLGNFRDDPALLRAAASYLED